MQRAAERLGITEQQYQLMKDNENIILPPFLITACTQTSAVFTGGNALRLGLSPFVMPISRTFDWLFNLLGIPAPRAIDALDLGWGLLATIHTAGPGGTHSLAMAGGMMCIGFVGYSLKFPFAMHVFHGFSVMTIAAGLGFHVYEPAG